MISFITTVPSRPYDSTVPRRSFTVIIPARAFTVSVPRRDFVFLNTSNRTTIYDPTWWVRWGQTNVYPFRPGDPNYGLTLQEIEERALAGP